MNGGVQRVVAIPKALGFFYPTWKSYQFCFINGCHPMRSENLHSLAEDESQTTPPTVSGPGLPMALESKFSMSLPGASGDHLGLSHSFCQSH